MRSSCRLQVALQLDELDMRILETSFDPAEHGCDGLLLGPIKVGGNDAVKVPIQELSLPSLKPSLLEVEIALNFHGLAGGARQFGEKGGSDVPAEFGSERDRPIQIEHPFLDHGYGDGGLRARRPSLMATAADEILIRHAVAVGCVDQI